MLADGVRAGDSRGVRAVWLALTLFACGPEVPVELAPRPETTPSTSTSSLPPTSHVLPSTITVWDSSVEGIVLGPDDEPLGDVEVTLCGTICQIRTTEADGWFRFEGPWPQINVLETLTFPGDDQADAALSWSHHFDLVPLEEDQHIVLDRPLRMHRVDTVTDLSGPQDLALDTDLRVAFDADAAGIPFPAERMALGATALTPRDFPTDTGEWTPIKAWTLAVWDLHLEGGFHATATLDEPLDDVDVAFLVADYVTGFRHGTFRVHHTERSPDGRTVSTLPDQGLDRTTLWVLATRAR